MIHAERDKDVAAALMLYIQEGLKKVERFFGQPFKQTFEVEVFPNRAAFDKYFLTRWKIPKTEAWMVASGVADRMVILSPRVWKTEAVEHDPADTGHIRDLIAHELVHVYHGQYSPRPDFDGMDNIGWFVEGLAVYVSGQLERSHRTAAGEALKAGKAPTRLADAWSGRYRYGVSGSMAEFVHQRYGLAVVKKMLVVVSNEEALNLLNTTEGEFLEAWKAHVSGQPADDPTTTVALSAFNGSTAGDEREVVGIKLCWCPPGRFLMGSPPDEPERRPGEDQIEVALTKGFWMAKYEATQGQWKRVMGKLPGELTAELPEGDYYPVGNVNFAEAEDFCRKLTVLGRQSGELANDWEFRLPTEAQWEYACRAGTTTATSFGDKLSSNQANFKGKPYNGAEAGPSLNRAAPVGSYPASPWGLHDMHGNVFEWCRDWYHVRLPGGADPDLRDANDSASKSEHGDVSRVRRGGCWADEGWACRSAFRLRFEPDRRYDHIGFRVVAVHL
jgi:formylglycine-generating enzyme required for sulfatase activity